MSQFPVPRKDVEVHLRVLIVLLGPQLCTPSALAKVKSAVQESPGWYRGPPIGDFILCPKTRQDSWGNHGILDDIYKISKRAKEHGWTSLLFFDEVSGRQLDGCPRGGEPGELCVTQVFLIPTMLQKHLPYMCTIYTGYTFPESAIVLNSSTFFIRRLRLEAALRAAGEHPDNWWVLNRDGFLSLAHQNDRLCLRGSLLRDPNVPVFGSLEKLRDSKLLAELCLTCKPELPEQLKSYIRDLLWQMPQGISACREPGSIQSDGSILGQALEGVPLDIVNQAVLCATRRFPDVPGPSLRFQAWPDYAPPTLREFCRIVATNTNCSKLPRPHLLFLISDANKGCHHLLSVKGSGSLGFKLQHEETVATDCRPLQCDGLATNAHHPIDPYSIYLDYHETFPKSDAPWKTAPHGVIQPRRRRGVNAATLFKLGRGDPRFYEYSAPLFYLVNFAPHATKKILLEELQTYSAMERRPEDWVKSYNEVGWRRNYSGTHEDILDLLRVMQRHESIDEQTLPTCAIFIDDRSLVDLHVIVAKLRVYVCPSNTRHVVGFDFARVPGRSASWIWYLSTCRSSQRYYRPRRYRPDLPRWYHENIHRDDLADAESDLPLHDNPEVQGKLEFYKDPTWHGPVQNESQNALSDGRSSSDRDQSGAIEGACCECKKP